MVLIKLGRLGVLMSACSSPIQLYLSRVATRMGVRMTADQPRELDLVAGSQELDFVAVLEHS